MRRTTISGCVLVDFTERIIALRTASVFLVIIWCSCVGNSKKHLMIFSEALEMSSNCSRDFF